MNNASAHRPSFRYSMALGGISTLLVLVGTVSAAWVTAKTPPDGLDCRHWLQGTIFGIWLFSAILNWPFSCIGHHRRFYCTFAKDVIATLLTCTGMLLALVGIFNRCSCWTKEGQVGLTLPYEPIVAAILSHHIKTWWPCIIGVCAAVQLLPLLMVGFCYREASHVFFQGDGDGGEDISIIERIQQFWGKFRLFGKGLRRRGTGGLLEDQVENVPLIEGVKALVAAQTEEVIERNLHLKPSHRN